MAKSRALADLVDVVTALDAGKADIGAEIVLGGDLDGTLSLPASGGPVVLQNVSVPGLTPLNTPLGGSMFLTGLKLWEGIWGVNQKGVDFTQNDGMVDIVAYNSVGNLGLSVGGNRVWDAGNLAVDEYAPTDANTITVGGSYFAAGVTNNKPANGTIWHGAYDSGSPSSKNKFDTQILVTHADPEMYFRGENNGVWSAWKQVWHDGNHYSNAEIDALIAAGGGGVQLTDDAIWTGNYHYFDTTFGVQVRKYNDTAKYSILGHKSLAFNGNDAGQVASISVQLDQFQSLDFYSGMGHMEMRNHTGATWGLLFETYSNTDILLNPHGTGTVKISGNEIWDAGNLPTPADASQAHTWLQNQTFNGTITLPDNATVSDTNSALSGAHQKIQFVNASGGLWQTTGRGGMMLASADDSLIFANGDVGYNWSSSYVNAASENMYFLSDGGFIFIAALQDGWGNVNQSALTFDSSGLKVDGNSFLNAGASSVDFTSLTSEFGIRRTTSLGSSINNFVDIATIQGLTSNSSAIDFRNVRFAAGTDWTTAKSRIQHRVDSTHGPYIDFQDDKINIGIVWGTNYQSAIADKLVIHSSGITTTGTSKAGYFFPTSGFYSTNGAKTLQLVDRNGYIGLESSSWVRTGANGLIPYQSGGASALGTSSWPFNSIYGKAIYENGKRVQTTLTNVSTRTTTGTWTITGLTAYKPLIISWDTGSSAAQGFQFRISGGAYGGYTAYTSFRLRFGDSTGEGSVTLIPLQSTVTLDVAVCDSGEARAYH